MNRLLKTLLLSALLAGGAAQSALAQSPASQTFQVAITLNSQCTLSAVPNVTFTYTSFQVAAAPASNGAGFDVRCTNGLNYNIGLFQGTVGPFTPPGAGSIGPITDAAVTLDYTLTLATTAAAGSGAVQNYSIGGSIAGNQGGTCATASCTNAAAGNRTHTLMVSW